MTKRPTKTTRTPRIRKPKPRSTGPVGKPVPKSPAESQMSALAAPAKSPLSQADRDRIDAMHTLTLGQHVYRAALKHFIKDEKLDATAVRYILDTMDGAKVRDPIESMLVMQMVWTHTRLAQLTSIATGQSLRDNVRFINEAADRAANTFRKQVLALAEYRRPPRAEAFTVIRQANVANQQVVSNAQSDNAQGRIATNEKGCALPAPLPAYRGGTGVPAGVNPAAEALGAHDGAADGGGQGGEQDERLAARRAERGGGGGEAGGGGTAAGTAGGVRGRAGASRGGRPRGGPVG